MKSVEVKVEDKINKPIHEVFDAIVAQDKITCYFFSRSSGPIRQGEKIIWYFDDYNVEVNVQILKVTENEHISFEWSAGGIKTAVDMWFSSKGISTTHVSITERSFPANEKGIKQALQQTQGWTDFLCSLKAFLYCSVNLRNGKKINL